MPQQDSPKYKIYLNNERKLSQVYYLTITPSATIETYNTDSLLYLTIPNYRIGLLTPISWPDALLATNCAHNDSLTPSLARSPTDEPHRAALVTGGQ